MSSSPKLVATLCIACGWEYRDTPGMGVHQCPARCPLCDGKVRTGPAFVTVTGRVAHETPENIAVDWKLRGV